MSERNDTLAIKPLLWAKEQTVITQTIRKKDGRYVASAPAPNPLDKLVLIAIGDEASENTWDALLGIEDIAVFVGCTRRAVRESLGRLERAGFVRCRDTRVESGRSGWKRIYLLSPESPLVQGLIEVDFSTVEQISRFQMRTFRDREKAGFVPSDSRRLLRQKAAKARQESAGHSEGEPRSSSEGRGNLVPPPRGNHVPPEGEPRSSSEGEPGSSPSFSSVSSSSSEERGESTATAKKDATIAEWAVSLIDELDFGPHVRPNQQQTRELARLVEAAHTDHGLDPVEIRRHCQSRIGKATTSAVAYLRGGLDPERLPRPQKPSSATPAVKPTWCGECDEITRLRERDTDGRPYRCPSCHPRAKRTPALAAGQADKSLAV